MNPAVSKNKLGLLILIWFIVYSILFCLTAQFSSKQTIEPRLPVVIGGDSEEYMVLSESLKMGKFELSDGKPETFRLPAYPAFLAVINIFDLPLMISVVQSILVLFTAIFIYKIGGSIPSILYLLEPSIMMYSQIVFSETLFMFFLVAAIYHAWKNSPPYIVGVLLGIATLIRPIVLYIAPLFIVYMLIQHFRGNRNRYLPVVVLLLISQFLIIAPWMFRNYSKTGFFGLTSLPAYNLAFYNVTGYLSARDNISTDKAIEKMERETGIMLEDGRNIENSNALKHYPLSVILSDPLGYGYYHLTRSSSLLFASSIKTVAQTYNGLFSDIDIFAGQKGLADLFSDRDFKGLIHELRTRWIGLLESLLWLVVFALAVMGTYKRRSVLSFFLFALIIYFFVLTGPVAFTRYRLPILPAAFILASYGIISVYKKRAAINDIKV